MPIKEGDLILLLPAFKIKKNWRIVIKVQKNKKTHTNFGSIDHDNIMKMDIGDVITTNTGRPFYILEPTLDDIIHYFSGFKYATQVIYPRDWGLIIAFADIKNGSKIVEIGTGSGAFTAFLTRIVGDSGFVYSYERDAERAKIALKNLQKMGVPPRYSIKVRDVSVHGIDEKNVDVVFIDVPEPWTVLKNAYDALKYGGRLVVYVPTYNQVEKTLIAFEEYPLVDIRILEGFTREIQAKHFAIRPELKGYYFSAFIIFSRKVKQKK